MATITPTVIDRPSGATLTGTLASTVAVAAAGGGDSFVLSGSAVIIRVINAGGGSINVTLNSVAVPTFPGGAQAADVDPVMAVANGASRMVRIPSSDFPRFANTTTGLLDVTYSGVTSVTVEAYTVS